MQLLGSRWTRRTKAFAVGVLFSAAVVGWNGENLAVGQDLTLDVSRVFVDDSVRGAVAELGADGSFSVGVRVKLLGRGNEPGNNDLLGMIFNVSSGWHDGFRAYYDWRSGRISFQIGRVAEKSAISAVSERYVAPGVLRDVVCSFDATSGKMTLYVDGELSATAPYSGPIETNGAPLNVGFGGFGVGSNRMFVEKVDYWKRALTAEEVANRFDKEFPKDELAKSRALETFDGSIGAAVVGLDDDVYQTALALEIPEETKSFIRKSYRENLFLNGNFAEAAKLTFADAKNALNAATETSKNQGVESQSTRNARLSDVGELFLALEKIANAESVADEIRVEARNLNAELGEKFPTEVATLKKIAALQDSAETVRQIERDALKRLNDVEATLERAAASADCVKICVAPNGSDDGDGSTNAPVASLARAFELAQNVAKSGDKTVCVELDDGVYRVDRTAALNGVSNVLVRPAKGASPVLSGAVEIERFQSLSDAAKTNANVAETLARFQDSAKNRIFVADLKASGVVDFGRLATRGYGVSNFVPPIPSLYVDGESQTLARWPNDGDGALSFGEVVENPNAPNKTTYRFESKRADGWKLTGNADVDDLWAFGLFQYEWAANFRRVEKLDRDAKTLTVDFAGGNDKFHFYFVNVLEELDAPGEYYVDKTNGLLYFLPPQELATVEKLAAARIEYDVFSEVFVKVEKSQNVLLKGLALRGGRESGVFINDCDSTAFVGGKIEQFGGNGALIFGGKYCGVLDSRLRELGSCGVQIRGGDRSQLVRANHIMSNCFVSDFSRIERVYAPAVHFLGCGVAITNNLFCDSPHHAMRTDGNDIYIARNEVHSVVYEYSDQSGVDIYCDPSFRGIVIEQNLWRHIGSAFALCGQAGIRLDDSISGVVMLDNVFYRSAGGAFGGIQIHGGKDNLCRRNVFVDCAQAFSFSVWDANRYLTFVKERFPQNVGNKAYLDAYPFFDEIFENPNRNYLIDNLSVNCGQYCRGGQTQEVFIGGKSRKIEPLDGDAYLTDANALRAKLEEIGGKPLKNVGLRKNWNGANLPVSPKFTTVKAE